MSSDVWACDDCGAEYTSKLAAAECCSEVYRGRE